jgi:ketosteroid isomerase-like protein
MSQENVELYHRSVESFNHRDWNAFLALMSEEVHVESRLVAMEGAYHGHEGVRRWLDAFLGSFSDYSLAVEEVRDLGDTTLAHARGRGHVAGSATPFIDSFWEALTWRDGKCVWWRNGATEADALKGAGLSK